MQGSGCGQDSLRPKKQELLELLDKTDAESYAFPSATAQPTPGEADFAPDMWHRFGIRPQIYREPTGSTISDRVGSIEEGGRTYQGFMPGEYNLPNDGGEQERLDLLHALYLLLLDGKLAAAPIQSPSYVLDIGTGTGIWALQFADEYPGSTVAGTDLSSFQPVTRKVQFWVENSETDEWVFPQPFDFIHIRSMGPCFNDFMTVIQKSYDHLAPGGYLELQDVLWEMQYMDDSARGTCLERWFQLLVIGAANSGRDMIKSKYYKDYLTNAGFVDVKEIIRPMAVGCWADNPRDRQIGIYSGNAVLSAVESYRRILLFSGLSEKEADDLADGVIRDMKEKELHVWFPMYFVYGRKPFAEKGSGTGRERTEN